MQQIFTFKNIVKNFIFYTILIFLFLGCSKEDKDDFIFYPKEQIKGFYTSDVNLFWEAYDYISPEFTKNNFQNIYINNGSVGLKDYAVQKQLATSLQEVFRHKEYKNYYSSIRTNTQDLNAAIDKSKDAFERFHALNPEVEIFDVYFLIGALTAGGRVSKNGLLIAVEMFSKSDDSHINTLNEWHRNVIKSTDFLPSIIVHELVHKQQSIVPKNVGYKTLLEQSILEGMADYISLYLLPNEPFINQNIHDFSDTIEQKLWNEFSV